MSESVNLPALGESVTEGTVTRWLKVVGDRVEIDEPLLEVSTDKVDTEIPSPIAGVIEAILVAEDETVEVGTPLVTIGAGPSGAGAVPEQSTAASSEAAEPTSTFAPSPVSAGSDSPEAAGSAGATTTAVPPKPGDPAGVTGADTSAETSAETGAETGAATAVPSPSEQDVPASPLAEPSEGPVVSAPVVSAPAAVAPVAGAPVAEVPSSDAPAPGEWAPTAPAAPAPAGFVDEAPAAVAPSEPEPVASAAPAPATVAPIIDAHPGYVTPLVRKLANEKGVDLTEIAGSGVGGRIRKEDVLTATTSTASVPEEVSGPSTAPLVTSPLRGTSVPMSRLRKVIAERAVISMQSSAQLTSVVEVDVTLVADFRDSVKAEFLTRTGQKLSFLPFFALAAAEALRAYPIINATIDGDTIVYPPHENMSIAVDTERGLLTPVIRDAGSLDLAGLATQIADLAARTRDNKLKPDELAGGTFTLTNTGSRGALFDTPIVFLPQSAILGTGIVAKKPVVVSSGRSDAIAIRSTVYLALSYDHRIVDGADAARFLIAVKNRLEGGQFASNLGY